MTSGEFTVPQTRIAKQHVFLVENKDVPIKWVEVDFERDAEYVGLPDRYVQFGVQYIPDNGLGIPEIRTSSKISEECQRLSALHEQWCMGDKVAECADVEAMVITLAPEEARQGYIDFRINMFGVLVADNPNNESFARSLDFLTGLQ